MKVTINIYEGESSSEATTRFVIETIRKYVNRIRYIETYGEPTEVERKDRESGEKKLVTVYPYKVYAADVKLRTSDELAQALIRLKYTGTDEFKVLRKATTDTEAFEEYNSYVESCIQQAHQTFEELSA